MHIESLCILCSVLLRIPLHSRRQTPSHFSSSISSHFSFATTIRTKCLSLEWFVPPSPHNRNPQSSWQKRVIYSSRRAIHDAEQIKRKWMLQGMPSSTSGSYTSTSVNRLISENHVVQSYAYSPGTVAFRSLCDCSTFRVSPRITSYRLLVTRRSAF